MKVLKFLTTFALLLACFCKSTISQKKGILYPRESESRSIKSLDGFWNFLAEPKDADNLGLREEWFRQRLEKVGEVEIIPVPCSFQELSQDRDRVNHIGWVWYDRDFWVPPEWASGNKRLFLRFGSVHYHAIVYVNGQLITQHRGGHLPFEAELDLENINFSQANFITVAVNNTLTNSSVPQGFLTYKEGEKFPPGHKIMSDNFDFFNYAGIHRSVVLYTTPKSFIDDITVTTTVSGTTGSVTYSIDSITDSENAVVTVRLLDKDGNVAAQNNGDRGTLQVPNANLWWPYTMVNNASDAGYLYNLEVTLNDGAIKDIYRLKIGIRQVSWSDTSFTINGRPFYFAGFGRHEDFFIRGRGFDPVLLVKDHNLIKWVGANSYRTTHYAYSEELMDIVDQLGIVIIDECAAVSLTLFHNDLLETHKNDLTELIRRDKNRPSVVMWSVANEPRSEVPESENYFRQIFEHARTLDTSRPFMIVLDTYYGRDLAAQFTDIIGFNRYTAWYQDAGELEIIQTAAKAEAYGWMNKFKKPLVFTEYGADTIAGIHTTPSWLFTEEFQEDYMREHFKTFDQMRKNTSVSFIGEMIWNFADFMTKLDIRRVVGNKKGIFTRDRQPKASAHLLRSRYHILANEFYGYPVPDDLHQSSPVYIPPGEERQQGHCSYNTHF